MRWRETIALLVLAGGSTPAGAQVLDLSGSPAPVVDASTASSELASFLHAQASEIRGRSEVDAGLACAAALRTLAGALLDSAQELGEPAGVRTVIARKIVRALPMLDAALTEGAVPAPMARLASVDLTALAGNLPRRQEQLDRALRDALAPITNALAEPVESGTRESLAAMVPDGSGLDHRDFELLDTMLDAAMRFPSHATSARRTHEAVKRAIRVLSSPGWMPAAARESLARSTVQAVSELFDAATADRAMTQLDRIGRFAQITIAVDGMRDDATRRVATERLGTLAIQLETSPNQASRAERAMSIVLGEVGGADLEEIEPWLPAPLRIAWRARQDELSSAKDRLVASMFELLDRSDPMIEPALLSALRAYREARANVAALVPIAVVLTDETPNPEAPPRSRPRMLKAYSRLSPRLLEAGRDLSDPGKADQSRQFLGTLAALAAAIEPEAGEAALVAGADGDEQSWWSRATGGRSGTLAERLETQRAAVRGQIGDLQQWPSAAETAADVQRIKDLVAMLSSLQVLDTAGLDRFNAHSCCELSQPAWNAATSDLTQRLAAATQRVLDGGAIDVDQFAPAHLLAIIASSQEPGSSGSAAHVLMQIGTGAPPDDRIAGLDRVGLGAICRNLEELASAQLRGEQGRATRLEEEVRSRASRVIESIPTSTGS